MPCLVRTSVASVDCQHDREDGEWHHHDRNERDTTCCTGDNGKQGEQTRRRTRHEIQEQLMPFWGDDIKTIHNNEDTLRLGVINIDGFERKNTGIKMH